MKRILLCVSIVMGICQGAHAQTSAPIHTLQTNDAEIDFQMKLNSLACKSVGQDDGGRVCDAAKFLNNKLLEAKKPKPEPPAEEKKP